jgi:hypothetical protein
MLGVTLAIRAAAVSDWMDEDPDYWRTVYADR